MNYFAYIANVSEIWRKVEGSCEININGKVLKGGFNLSLTYSMMFNFSFNFLANEVKLPH